MTLDRRRTARELAMQALCQLDVQGEAVRGMLPIFFRQETDDPMTLKLAEEWTQGVWQRIDECDRIIAQAAIRWKLSRLSMVDRAILRLAVWQLRHCADMPQKVVLNEAIEIAKKYSSEQSPRFINGVLDAVMKNLNLSANNSVTEEAT